MSNPAILTMILIVVAFVSWVIQGRSDRERIHEEAEKQHAEVWTIRRCWIPFRTGPFEWFEVIFPGSRLFWVKARDRGGQKRTAYVLIGPRRFIGRWATWDSRMEQWYGTLTWRWAGRHHSRTD